ncbi:Phosphoribosyl 1,2-cyclic phosphodiesterase [Granulicatella balaenopterae]|uniref:Phosphoribosyl 1,2-cyclic phosphodiesterase n=1 Tax=Granulicatella balaenopterae TaxID=137733 RepID=A0A1H9M975_9LACT|nr:MBL fold metallo-hydrolase [Granulicatella balaenopterae]SER20007.1 Phosphoribosyl 1,2-cyclic phosphodiesterase [Granulicatella balaenopterae]
MELESTNEGFKVCLLASGSSGNATYIETPKRRILVDCGFSGKAVEAMMNKIDRSMKDVDSILVTHEHSDHIQGVGVLARRYHLDVYANEKTWEAMMPKLGKIDPAQKHIFEPGITKTFGDIDVMSFSVSHDAADPQFYSFQKDNKQFVLLTDTGYVSERLRGLLANADGYLMESNHDLEMLRMGPYAWHLKQRILGDQGHLSNEDGALAAAEMVGDKTKRIFLGHLSKENNMKDLAYQTAESILMEKDCGLKHQFNLYHTDPAEPTELFDV